MYVRREIELRLEKLMTIPHIIALVGPRRSGKTTLLQQWIKKYPGSYYISFEDPHMLQLFQEDIQAFAELYIKPYQLVCLDEFHYASEGGKLLKYIYDFYPDTKLIVSGSSALDITVKAIKFLVGRVVVVHLFPFSFREFLLARRKELLNYLENHPDLSDSPLLDEVTKLWEEYVVYGGYPEVVLQEDVELKSTLLTNIYSTYLLREVREIVGLLDDYKFSLLLRALALQIGNMINFQELSSITGYNYRTLKHRLNLLEQTYVIKLIRPYFSNKRKELTKNPKVYFYDTGLRNAIINNFQKLVERPDAGSLCENYVIGALERANLQPRFWRTKSRQEVDVVVERNGHLFPLEVKCIENFHRLPSGLRAFIREYPVPQAWVLHRGHRQWHQSIEQTTVHFLPMCLLEFQKDFVNGSQVQGSES